MTLYDTSPPSYSSEELRVGPCGKETPIVIVVMGGTGVGKSTFIRYATGQNAVVGHEIRSCTDEVQTFKVPNTNIYLFDTPGFDDVSMMDSDILEMIAEQLSECFRDEVTVAGVLYLHPITTKRMQRSMVKNLTLFKNLVGEDNLKSCSLVTTMWGRQPLKESEKREHELCKHPQSWLPLIMHGVRVERFRDSEQSARDIVFKTASQTGFVPKLTQEYVMEGKSLSDTTAGAEVSNNIDHLIKEHNENIATLKQELESKLAAENRSYSDVMKQQREELEAKVWRLKQGQDRMVVKRSSVFSRNELLSRSDRPVLVIYAKAMTEIGNIGPSGFLFSQAVKKVLPSQVAFQGTAYDAISSIFSFFKGGPESAIENVLNAVNTAAKDPEKKIFLCGYNHGAMIMCKAYGRMNDKTRARITGIILFGNPEKGGSKLPRNLENKVLDLLLPFDFIRLPIPVITAAHFMYPILFSKAIKFLQSKVTS